MLVKYKLGDLAKDLELTNKELIGALGPFGTDKKHTTVLTGEELNYVFDVLTRRYTVDNFDAYYVDSASGKEPEKKAEEKTNNEKASNSSKNIDNEKNNNPKDNRGENFKNQIAGAKTKETSGSAKDSQAQNNKPSKRPNQGGAAQRATTRIRADRPEKADKPVETKEKVSRVVDTRASVVDIDKYNEKYENIAQSSSSPASGKRGNQQQSHKKKINQRSAQKGRPQSAKRETEAQRLQRLQLEKARNAQLKIMVPDQISVGELASRLKQTAPAVIKKLMTFGIMTSISEDVDYDTAVIVAEEFGAKVEHEVHVSIEERLNIAETEETQDNPDEMVARPAVVVVMGHVDHGKTSLLDYIRHTNVIAGEAGGITQHIGAYQVKADDRVITFLDTPGHEAFTAMRARGASITDIAILVVAADDGIMPQTVEAINHAKAAGITIIVAINKIDKPDANPEKVKQGLTEYNLVPEEWGGDVICVPVSAKTGQGVETLLEMVNLVSEVKELKANPNRMAKGTVIEARIDKGRGPIASILVQNGTLHPGDVIIAGTAVGRVRAMTDDKGQKLESAGPSTPVEITGLVDVPNAGDTFNVVEDERLARELVDQRRVAQKEEQFKSYQKVTLDNLFSQIEEGERKELSIIVKADVQGSAEAIKQNLEQLSNDEVRVHVIHSAVGGVNDSDVMLAEASDAVIIGFNVRPDPMASDRAERSGVDMHMYRVIYDAIDDVKGAMSGMLAPKYREVDQGRAEVRLVYKISSVGTVAGCYVQNGVVKRNSLIRIVRDGIIINDDKIASLKRIKDDVKEVAQGFECGITLEKFADFKEGDVLESYIMEEYRD